MISRHVARWRIRDAGVIRISEPRSKVWTEPPLYLDLTVSSHDASTRKINDKTFERAHTVAVRVTNDLRGNQQLARSIQPLEGHNVRQLGPATLDRMPKGALHK